MCKNDGKIIQIYFPILYVIVLFDEVSIQYKCENKYEYKYDDCSDVHCIVLCCIVLSCTVLYYITVYCIVLYSV